MTDPEPRLSRQEQAFRNLVTALVIGGIVVVIAVLYFLLIPGSSGAIGALCSIGFLFVAFLGWEYLMKPGYGFLHPRRIAEDEDEEPPSPGAP